MVTVVSVATVVALVSALDDHWLGYAIGAGIGVIALVLLWRHPGLVLIAVTVLLPLEQTGFGLFLHAGVGNGVVRALSGVNELLVACVGVSAVVAVANGRRRPAAVDIAALGYLAVVGLYLVLPHLLAPGAPLALHARLEALRSDGGYVAVFLAARHAPLTERDRRGLRTAVMAVGTLMVAGALLERLFPLGWRTFMLNYADANVYLSRVLGEGHVQVADSLRYLDNIRPLRVGSFFYSPFDLADFLLIVAAVCIERIVRGDRRWPPFVLLCAALASLWYTEVRADVVALAVVVFVALTRRYHPRAGRLRLLFLLAAAALVALPVLSGSRFGGAHGAAVSSTVHVKEVEHGIRVFLDHPLGLGLGEQSGSAAYLPGATGGQTSLTSDNAATQVADELGVLGLVTWLAFVIVVLISFARERAGTSRWWAGAGFLALLGTLVAGLSHQVFVEYEVPWVLWAVVGVGLPYRGPSRQPVSEVPVLSGAAP